MKLKYQTAAATMVQLGIMLLLNVITTLLSTIATCVKHDSCVENVVVNLLYIAALAVWLLFVAALGYMAEHRRSRKFALVLIAAEAMIAIVTLANAKHFPNLIGLITSLVDFGLAVWVGILAVRLRNAIAKNPEVTKAPAGQRPRKRVKT